MEELTWCEAVLAEWGCSDNEGRGIGDAADAPRCNSDQVSKFDTVRSIAMRRMHINQRASRSPLRTRRTMVHATSAHSAGNSHAAHDGSSQGGT